MMSTVPPSIPRLPTGSGRSTATTRPSFLACRRRHLAATRRWGSSRAGTWPPTVATALGLRMEAIRRGNRPHPGARLARRLPAPAARRPIAQPMLALFSPPEAGRLGCRVRPRLGETGPGRERPLAPAKAACIGPMRPADLVSLYLIQDAAVALVRTLRSSGVPQVGHAGRSRSGRLARQRNPTRKLQKNVYGAGAFLIPCFAGSGPASPGRR